MCERLASDAGQFRSEVVRLLDAVDQVARGAAIFGRQKLAVRNLLRRGGVEMHIRQQIGIRLVPEESSKQGKLRIGETVVRHGGCRIVDSGVVQPSPQPFWLHLIADPG